MTISDDDRHNSNGDSPPGGSRTAGTARFRDDDTFAGDPTERVDDDVEDDADMLALSESLTPGHDVMRRRDIRAALHASGYDGGSFENLSSGEEQRIRMLLKYKDASLFRPHVIGNVGMLAELELLNGKAPNFAAVTRLARRATQLSQLAGTPIRIPPTCLVGSPGIGKSRYVRLLAAALGTSCDIVGGATLPDVSSLTGYPPVWRGAGPGRIAKYLIAARTSGPLIFIDEAEKINDYEAMTHPLDRLLPILEYDTASEYQDENLLVPMAAQHATILFACNSLDALSAPFRDRVAIIRIPDLSAAQRDAVLDAMLTEVASALGVPMSFAGPTALAPLRALSPRRCRLAIEIALATAVDNQRRFVTAVDLAEAVALLNGGSHERSTFGFHPAGGAERP